MTNIGHKASSHLMHTVGVRHACRDIGHHHNLDSLFRPTLKSSEHNQWDILLQLLILFSVFSGPGTPVGLLRTYVSVRSRDNCQTKYLDILYGGLP